MPEFTPISPGGGNNPSRGKLKLNKKTILLYGGIGVGAFVFINALMSGGRQSQEAGGTVVPDGLPTNSADVQAQMQNFQNIMEGQLDSGLNQLANELYSDNLASQNDLKSLLDQSKKDYEQQLQELKSNQSVMQPQPDNISKQIEPMPISHTIGYGLPSPTPAGVKPNASAGLAAIQSGNKQALNAEIARANSVINYRKSQGLDTSLQDKYITSLLKGGKP